MSAKRFEEQVRESMEELKFSPSENVWAGVVSELDKRRKRRVALWWIPVGLLLLGSVYFWNQSQFDQTNSFAKKEQNQNVQEVQEDKTTSPDGNVQGLNSVQNDDQANKNISEIEKYTEPGVEGSGLNSNDGKNKNVNTVSDQEENLISEIATTKSEPLQKTNSLNSHKYQSSETVEKKSYEYLIEKNNESVGNLVISDNKLNENSGITNEVEEEKIESSSLKFFPQKSFTLNEIKSTLPLKNYQLSSAAPAKSILRNWSYGLTVAAGVSGIYDRNLIRQTDATSRNSLAFLPANSSSIVYRTAVVEPGAFYAIGGIIERPLGRIFNLSAGLNYTHYNSKVNVGSKISRSTTIFPGTTDNQDIPYYYSPDPKGSYQMHHSMLEIPVTIRATYKSFSANAGITGSTLVSSDMLAFDARSGVYYKEKDKLNRFQFGLTGGFDVAVLKRAKYPLYIGPVFRYQVSDITSRYSDSRHLISAALQARFYLQK